MRAADSHDRDISFRGAGRRPALSSGRPPACPDGVRLSGGSVMTDPNGDLAPEGVRPAAELLPEVYAELRRLAAALTVKLPPGQTLQPTALVHEAYLRL